MPSAQYPKPGSCHSWANALTQSYTYSVSFPAPLTCFWMQMAVSAKPLLSAMLPGTWAQGHSVCQLLLALDVSMQKCLVALLRDIWPHITHFTLWERAQPTCLYQRTEAYCNCKSLLPDLLIRYFCVFIKGITFLFVIVLSYICFRHKLRRCHESWPVKMEQLSFLTHSCA